MNKGVILEGKDYLTFLKAINVINHIKLKKCIWTSQGSGESFDKLQH